MLIDSLTRKCAKFVVGKKTPTGDKAPVRDETFEVALDFDSTPFLHPDSGMKGPEDWQTQAEIFENLIVNDTAIEGINEDKDEAMEE